MKKLLHFIRTYIFTLLITIGAVIFWITYRQDDSFWWIIIIAGIFLFHYGIFSKKDLSKMKQKKSAS